MMPKTITDSIIRYKTEVINTGISFSRTAYTVQAQLAKKKNPQVDRETPSALPVLKILRAWGSSNKGVANTKKNMM